MEHIWFSYLFTLQINIQVEDLSLVAYIVLQGLQAPGGYPLVVTTPVG